MKSFTLALLFSSVAFAETATFTVEGMHCASCKNIVNQKVCENEAIAKTAETCTVTITDTEKQIGEVVIVSKKDAKINPETVKAAVTTAGEYKVTKAEIKEMITKDLNTATAATTTTEEKAPKGKEIQTTTTTNTTETATTDETGKTTKEVKTTKKIQKKIVKAMSKKTSTEKEKTETEVEIKKETK